MQPMKAEDIEVVLSSLHHPIRVEVDAVATANIAKMKFFVFDATVDRL